MKVESPVVEVVEHLMLVVEDIVVEVEHCWDNLGNLVEDNSQIEDLDYMHSEEEDLAKVEVDNLVVD